MERTLTDTEQPGALLLHGPIELVSASVSCWRCGRATTVFALTAADVQEVGSSGELLECARCPAFVYDIGKDDMPADLVSVLRAAAPGYRPIFSRTIRETTWANACGHCGMLQGAFFMHNKPDGPFFCQAEQYTGERLRLRDESVFIRGAGYSL